MEITVSHLKEIEDEALIQEMLFSMPGEMLLAALERILRRGKANIASTDKTDGEHSPGAGAGAGAGHLGIV